MQDSRIQTLFAPFYTSLSAVIDQTLDTFAPLFYPGLFDIDTPTTTIDYATVVGRSRIESAASVIAFDSQSPMRSLPQLDKYTGSMSQLSATYPLTQQQLRTWIAISNSPNIGPDAIKAAIMKLLGDTITRAGNAPHKRVDIMVLQAMSMGKIRVDPTTNPDGVTDITDIDLLVQAQNRFKASVSAWTQANVATMTPVSDITNIVNTAWQTRGLLFAKIYIDYTTWLAVRNSAEAKSVIAGYFLINSGVGTVVPTVAQFNEYLDSEQMPQIVIVREQIAVEFDGKPVASNPWAAGQVTFVPAGKLGVIHNALDIEQLFPVQGIQYASYRGALISKWSQTNPFNDYTRGSWIAMPGLEAVDRMFFMDTTTATGTAGVNQ